MAVLPALLLVGCGNDSGGRQVSVDPRSEQSAADHRPLATAAAVCGRQLDGVVRAQMWTVGALRRIGPDPMPPRGLSRYPAGAPVALCLVPRGGDRYTVVAIVRSDGSRRPVWTQTSGTDFTPPA